MSQFTDSSGKPIDWFRLTSNDIRQYNKENLAQYDGDSYLMDQMVEAEEDGGWGYTCEEAEKKLSDPDLLIAFLEQQDYGLLEILSDRMACRALKHAILKRKADVIEALIAATEILRVPKKRGPKRKKGLHTYERVYKLKAKGLSHRKIAIEVFKDPKRVDLVKAHLKVARKAQLFKPAADA